MALDWGGLPADRDSMHEVGWYEAEERRLAQEAGDQLSRWVEGAAGLPPTRREPERIRHELHQLKQHIVLDLKEIHTHHNAEMGRAATQTHSVTVFLSGPAAAGHRRANDKRAISRSRAQTIEPYNRAKLGIDQTLTWISQQKQAIVIGGTPQVIPPQPPPALRRGGLSRIAIAAMVGVLVIILAYVVITIVRTG